MSVEAISWVLNDAPDVPSQLVSTLIGIANHATPDGRNAYPSQARLAKYTRKSERQIRRDLGELAKRGLIRRGDQRIVEHLPQDRRPVVYDLSMDLDGGTSTSPRSSTSARTPVTERGDMGVRGGGTSTSAKPSLEPSVKPSEIASQGARDPIPDWAAPLVQRIQTSGLPGITWNMRGDDWFTIHSLIKSKGVEAMADFAVRSSSASRQPVFSARYFIKGWKELPDAPPPGMARPSPAGPRRRSARDEAFLQHQELKAEMFGPPDDGPPLNLIRGELA